MAKKYNSKPSLFYNLTTANQHKYMKMLQRRNVVLATGCAGTGKTYLSLACAVESLNKGSCDKIIITRPNIETGKTMGYLPGSLQEKFQPFTDPIFCSLRSLCGEQSAKKLTSSNKVVFKPLVFMRGTTFSNCIVIIDEAQNATSTQLKMMMTRIGKNCKVFINGDTSQCDLGDNTRLNQLVDLFGGYGWFGCITFDQSDIVRSGIVRDVVIAYDNLYEKKSDKIGFTGSHSPSFML